MTVVAGAKYVAVFGGSGFLGKVMSERFSAQGITVRAASRQPDEADFRAASAQVGGIEPVYADVRDESSVALAMEGCDAVVNAVDLYLESGPETFEAVHEIGALNVAHQTAALGIDRLIHISGNGADRYSNSSYVRARGKGELLVLDVCPYATVLRPSVMFGPSDRFLNALAQISLVLPVFPLFGQGETRLQPVYVCDVADAALTALQSSDARGKCYELGGPQVYTYRSLIEQVLSCAGRKRLLLPVPFPVWELLARLASVLPAPPVTQAQVTLLKLDNVIGSSALSLSDLGVTATALETILPKYTFRAGGL